MKHPSASDASTPVPEQGRIGGGHYRNPYWRFEPYVVDGKAVEVETGLVFGLPRFVAR